MLKLVSLVLLVGIMLLVTLSLQLLIELLLGMLGMLLELLVLMLPGMRPVENTACAVNPCAPGTEAGNYNTDP